MGRLNVRFVRYEGIEDVRMDKQERIDVRMGKGPNKKRRHERKDKRDRR